MLNQILAVVLWVLIVVITYFLDFGVPLYAKRFWSWFKGSRKTYFLSGSSLDARNAKIESMPNRFKVIGLINRSVIEINLGFWRRRSTIHGLAKDWEIAGQHEGAAGLYVHMNGTLVLSPESALRLINTYSSPVKILNRISELESSLFLANASQKDYSYGIAAILSLIEKDRQRYRSKAAQNIREHLEHLSNRQLPLSEIKLTE